MGQIKLDHISIILSSEAGVEFYKNLGFIEISRTVRPQSHDELIYLAQGEIILEIYKDATHPPRLTKPEALGLRHLGFQVADLDRFLAEVRADVPVKEDAKGRFAFLYDPDGLPLEIREIVPKEK